MSSLRSNFKSLLKNIGFVDISADNYPFFHDALSVEDSVWSDHGSFVKWIFECCFSGPQYTFITSASSADLMTVFLSDDGYRLLVDIAATSVKTDANSLVCNNIIFFLWKLWEQKLQFEATVIADLMTKFVNDFMHEAFSVDLLLTSSRNLIPEKVVETIMKIMVEDDWKTMQVFHGKKERSIFVVKSIIRYDYIVSILLKLLCKSSVSTCIHALSIFLMLLEHDSSNVRSLMSCDQWNVKIMQIMDHLHDISSMEDSQGVLSIEVLGNGIKMVLVKPDYDDAGESKVEMEESASFTKALFILFSIYSSGCYFSCFNCEDDAYFLDLIMFPMKYLKDKRGWNEHSVFLTRMFLYSIATKINNSFSSFWKVSFSSSPWKNLFRVLRAVEIFILFSPIVSPQMKPDDIASICGIHLNSRGAAEDLILVKRLNSILSECKEYRFDPSLSPNIDKSERQSMMFVWNSIKEEHTYFSLLQDALNLVATRKKVGGKFLSMVETRQSYANTGQDFLSTTEITAAFNFYRRRAAQDLGKMKTFKACSTGKSNKFGKDSSFRGVYIDIELYAESDHSSGQDWTKKNYLPDRPPSPSSLSNIDYSKTNVTSPPDSPGAEKQVQSKTSSKKNLSEKLSFGTVSRRYSPAMQSPTAPESQEVARVHADYPDCKCHSLLIRDSSSTAAANLCIEDIEISKIKAFYCPKYESTSEGRTQRNLGTHRALSLTSDSMGGNTPDSNASTPLRKSSTGTPTISDEKYPFKLTIQTANSDNFRDFYFISEDERLQLINSCLELNNRIFVLYGPEDDAEDGVAHRSRTHGDKSVMECELGCGLKFSLLNRRRVCYQCRKTCCSNCANQKISLPEFDYAAEGSTKFLVCISCLRAREDLLLTSLATSGNTLEEKELSFSDDSQNSDG